MSNEDYTKKWLNDTLSEEEKKVFAQSLEYESLEKLSQALMSFRAPNDYKIQDEYQRLQFNKVKEGKVVALPWLKPFLRIAAALMVAAGAYFIFLSNPTTTIKTLASENVEVFLPDSSKVTLNALSQISYHKKSWNKARQLELKGEAFFAVSKGSRFDVETTAGKISVLGTKFNVKNRNNFFEVICYEGLVEVKSAKTIVKLLPGKVFRIINGVTESDLNTAEPTADWLSNESSFESVPFGQVIAEFERQYDVTITIKNINIDQLFTGRFVHSDISLALKSITIPLKLNYQLDNDQKNVVLSGETK